jgi:S-adenosylmethionine:diacylglycerol 3-amino-3-carboxypropyl transferase
MPILFSQVREDPTIEQKYVSKLNSTTPNALRDQPSKCLIVCSGGCTLLSIIQDDVDIDVIDMNIEQIYLTELKLALAKQFNKKPLLHYLENNVPDVVVGKLELSDDCREYWNDNKDSIKLGINNCGKFEVLFRELVKSDFSFEKIFDRDHLTSIFGESAVINSLNNEFYDHFKQVMDYYKSHYNNSENYFYNQILHGRYDVMDLPPYFNNLDNIKTSKSKITMINQNMITYLKKCSDNEYDLIQTSNLSDWMDGGELLVFIKHVHRCLMENGVAIMRRLNSDIKLESVLGKYFKIIDRPVDRSHFYKEVLVLAKL